MNQENDWDDISRRNKEIAELRALVEAKDKALKWAYGIIATMNTRDKDAHACVLAIQEALKVTPAESLAKKERVRKALEFYAKKEYWTFRECPEYCKEATPEPHDHPPAIIVDQGHTAREALKDL